jgi:hypothetical protein
MVADSVVVGRLEYPSEVAAVQAVLSATEVIASVFVASRRGQSTEDRRLEIEDRLEDILVTVAALRPAAASSLDAFAEGVRDALQKCAWWPPTADPNLPLLALHALETALLMSERP